MKKWMSLILFVSAVVFAALGFHDWYSYRRFFSHLPKDSLRISIPAYWDRLLQYEHILFWLSGSLVLLAILLLAVGRNKR